VSSSLDQSLVQAVAIGHRSSGRGQACRDYHSRLIKTDREQAGVFLVPSLLDLFDFTTSSVGTKEAHGITSIPHENRYR
jgi:hypothetical protein